MKPFKSMRYTLMNSRLFREFMEREAREMETTIESKQPQNHNDTHNDGFLCCFCEKTNPNYSQLFMLDV